MEEIEILEQQAVDSAMNSNWEKAVELNLKLLEIDKKNIGGILRLGYAYLQTKQTKEAREYYNKALRIQPGNQVALDQLDRLAILEQRGVKNMTVEKSILNPDTFLETPGKTKTVALVNLGQKDHLVHLLGGQEVLLNFKKRRLEIRTRGGEYIGGLPDDLSKRLTFFLKAKSVYSVFIKEAIVNKVVVFIREESKGRKVAHYISFPSNIQTNLDKMGQEDIPEGAEEDTTEDEDEWEKLANEIDSSEKEELVNIPPEEDENEE
ncbi:MAG: tetratricopeptide repeat protein [Candidatus Roizmanbacteria bacterium]